MRSGRIIVLFFLITISHDLSGSVVQDTMSQIQVLYNGRIWRNLYYMVEGDQFLFTDSFLQGRIVIRGKEFSNLTLKYDIFKDEILIPLKTGRILQVNKQMVDSFTIVWQNRNYHFTKIPEDSLKGYVHVLYKGKTSLYIKYIKKIEKLADQGKYDKFYQTSQTYYVKDSIIHSISGKKDLKKVMGVDKDLINSFIRKSRLKISKNNPESYIPLIRYIDNLSQ